MKTGNFERDAVLLRLNVQGLCLIDSAFDSHLKNFGFSDVVTDQESDTRTQLAATSKLSDLLTGLANGRQVSGQEIWSAHEATVTEPGTEPGVVALDLTRSDVESCGAVALMATMSLPHIPLVTLNCLPQDLPRNIAHYLRSLVFWRNRNGIARLSPRFVHAAEDGSLIYILGFWMVALNWTNEEMNIDIGDTGSMWLMLGSPGDVQLQGNLLVLPAYSGAILANELAR